MQNIMKLALIVLVGCSLGLTFDVMVALGDSISDTGLVYALSGGKVPPSPPYWKGRFSNGPTWIEYISTHFKAKLESFAHGQATTDSTVYKIKSPLEIPGCVQQAEKLKSSKDPSQVLLSFAFFGNDFFVPGAKKEVYFENIMRCLNLVINKNVSSHILIPTRFAPETFPSIANSPAEVRDMNAEAAQYIAKSWERKLPELSKDHPLIKFYEFDFKEAIVGIKEYGIQYCKGPYKFNTTAACLTTTPFSPEGNRICDNPSKFMFFDPLHPSARVHEALAQRAIATINGYTPRCFNSALSSMSK